MSLFPHAVFLVREPRVTPDILHILHILEYGCQSIHAQTIITFVFQEQTVTRASMPKP